MLQGLAVEKVKSIADGIQGDSGTRETVRAALQAVVGCAGAAAGGSGGCTSAAAGAAASVVLNNLLSTGTSTDKDGNPLSIADQDARTNLVATLIAAIASGVGADASAATTAAIIETQNNSIRQPGGAPPIVVPTTPTQYRILDLSPDNPELDAALQAAKGEGESVESVVERYNAYFECGKVEGRVCDYDDKLDALATAFTGAIQARKAFDFEQNLRLLAYTGLGNDPAGTLAFYAANGGVFDRLPPEQQLNLQRAYAYYQQNRILLAGPVVIEDNRSWSQRLYDSLGIGNLSMSARFFGEAASRCTISCGNLDNVDLSDRGSISRAYTNDARNNFAAGLGALAFAPHDLGVGQTFRGVVGLPLDTVQGIGALVTTDPRTTLRGIGNSLSNPFSSLRACPPGNLVCVGANAPGPADVVFGEATALGTARTFSTFGTRTTLLAEDALVIRGAGSAASEGGIIVNERLAGSIRNVNPGYPITGRTENCLNCAIATDATLSGRPTVALPSNGPVGIAVLETRFGGTFSAPMTTSAIEQQLLSAGNGSRGIVYGSRGANRVGHVFNVVNQNGVIRFLDGQTGRPASLRGYQQFHILRTDGK